MPERIGSRLTYANVTATVALVLALAGSAMMVVNLIDGSSSGTSGGATWFLAGSGNELPSCTSCEVSLPASGSGTWGSTQNTGNDQLSPNVTIVATDFSVRVDTAPGGAATRTFALYFRSAGAGISLRCDISGSNTTCNSGAQSLMIPARSSLLVDAANSGNAPATKIQFSWRATPQ
jgi:hypothetical protein